jgi:hypothetical protein
LSVKISARNEQHPAPQSFSAAQRVIQQEHNREESKKVKTVE